MPIQTKWKFQKGRCHQKEQHKQGSLSPSVRARSCGCTLHPPSAACYEQKEKNKRTRDVTKALTDTPSKRQKVKHNVLQSAVGWTDGRALVEDLAGDLSDLRFEPYDLSTIDSTYPDVDLPGGREDADIACSHEFDDGEGYEASGKLDYGDEFGDEDGFVDDDDLQGGTT